MSERTLFLIGSFLSLNPRVRRAGVICFIARLCSLWWPIYVEATLQTHKLHGDPFRPSSPHLCAPSPVPPTNLCSLSRLTTWAAPTDFLPSWPRPISPLLLLLASIWRLCLRCTIYRLIWSVVFAFFSVSWIEVYIQYRWRFIKTNCNNWSWKYELLNTVGVVLVLLLFVFVHDLPSFFVKII